jgi:hypothetical protein
MNKNPYTELYEIIKGVPKSEASFFIAKVINPLPNLVVNFEGIELDKDNLLISKSLLISNNANVTCTDGTITHNLQDSLSIGDKVLLYRINDTFIVIDKVVSLNE